MTTLVFPGQGSQFLGMSKDFYDNFEVAKSTLNEIQDYVKMDLKNIIFENRDNLLNFTNYTQISIFTASVIIFRTLLKETELDLSKVEYMLGHSLGEYTALACSNKLSLEECSLVLKKRGQLMHDATSSNKTGMAALIGKDADYVDNIIKKNNIDLQIANDNSPIQVVISGKIDLIKNYRNLFLQNDIKKYVILNVSAAFHSQFMEEAQKILGDEIESLNFSTNHIKIISNYDSSISNDTSTIKKALKNQMANKVQWTQSIRQLENNGQKKIIEVGPGKVLSGLIKRISSNFDIKSINEISDLDLND